MPDRSILCVSFDAMVSRSSDRGEALAKVTSARVLVDRKRSAKSAFVAAHVSPEVLGDPNDEF